MKILLASNTDNILVNAKASLEKKGHEVVVVNNGVQAWIQLCDAEISFQVVISEWLLPQLTGVELCRKIKAAPFSSETYVILVANQSGTSDQKEGLEAGADDLLLLNPLNNDVINLKLRTAERMLELKKTIKDKSVVIDALNLKLEQQSTKDKLTGLYNRRSFHRHLEDRLRLSQRMELPISLLMLDINRFKEYKEQYGEVAGDGIIRLITNALKEHSRTSDLVARFGGEKFGIILPNTDAAGAAKCAEGLCRATKNLFWESDPVSISIGAGTIAKNTYSNEPICDLHTRILSEADQALYLSQSVGQNKVSHFTDINKQHQAAN